MTRTVDARWVFFGLLGAAVIAGLVWAVRVWSGKGEVKRLREQYLHKTGLPLDLAYESMERQLERVMKKHPGRSMKWYLRTLLAELKRDRR